jgi:DNA-binding SARP family transcriptional activator/Tfp pilus assembly protein PilF
VEFGVLGPVEVWVDGRPAGVGHARQRAVLAVLVLEAGRVVPLEMLVDRVWGEDPPRSVRNVVYGYVGRLKTLIAADLAPGVMLSRRAGGYLLQARPDQVDVHRFRGLAAEAAAAAGDDERAGVLLGEALALWRGSALAGLDSPWLDGQRTRLELERAAAAGDLRDIRLRRGEHAALAAELAAQAAESPADERLVGQLMLSLYRCGRQADALRWFEQTRRHLADELGTDPRLELRALHVQILRAEPSLGLVPKPRIAVSTTTTGPTAPPPRELPADVPAFTGRVAELAELDRLLTGTVETSTATPVSVNTAAEVTGSSASADRVPTAVISAVSGTAGVGKTALAVHWAHRAASRFPDGQLYVNLRGYDPGDPVTAAEALTGFLRALGVPGQDIPAEPGPCAAKYRSLLAGRRMLVLLDNAGHAEQVRPLLPGTPGCAMLVTSRDSLAGLVARDGATRLDLDLLPLEDAVSLLRELIGARADAELNATAELAQQCSRLPLALRVAAEFVVAHHTVALKDLVAELANEQRQLDLLDADSDPRAAVRSVFSWSCKSLDTATARVFRLAGLHPGPDFSSDATAALADVTVELATRMLDRLAHAHLIQTPAPGRYGLHDLLRAYARELVTAEDGDDEQRQALTRLFDHHLHTAARAMDTILPGERSRRPRVTGPTILGPSFPDPAAARAWLDSERPSLVAIVAYAARHGWHGHAMRMAATLPRYLDYGGHYREGTIVYDHARYAARQAGDRAAEAQALKNLALAGWRQGQYQQAARQARQAAALFRMAGDRLGQASALDTLGVVRFHQGSNQPAARHFRQAVTLFREVGDVSGLAGATGNLAGVDMREGHYEQAARHLRQALALFAEIGNRAGQGSALNNLGIVEERQGHYEEAASYHSQALELFRETGYRASEAHALNYLGRIDQRQGRHRQAVERQLEALALFGETGDRAGEAMALNGLGEAYLSTGQADDAHAWYTAALGLAGQVGNKHEQARAHNGLGQVHSTRGDVGPAREHWQKALTIYTELDLREADQVRAQLADEGATTGVRDETSAALRSR